MILEKSKEAGYYEFEDDSIQGLSWEVDMPNYVGSYTGTVKLVDGVKLQHGFGRECITDEGIYEGQFKNGEYHGYIREC